MKRTRWWSGVLVAGLVALPLSLVGQQGPGTRRGPGAGPGGGPGGGVEQVMRMRERLGLSEQQLQRLEEIRSAQVAERSERQAQMAELRSRALAGGMEEAELRETLRAQREDVAATREAQREQVLAILDQAQRDSLQQLGARARAFRMGRESALRGRGEGRPGPRGRQELGRDRGFRDGLRGARPRGPGEGLRRGFGPGRPDVDGEAPPMRRDRLRERGAAPPPPPGSAEVPPDEPGGP